MLKLELTSPTLDFHCPLNLYSEWSFQPVSLNFFFSFSSSLHSVCCFYFSSVSFFFYSMGFSYYLDSSPWFLNESGAYRDGQIGWSANPRDLHATHFQHTEVITVLGVMPGFSLGM